MRLVLARPWRAFPELDGLPDGECRRVLDVVRRRHSGAIAGVTLGASGYIFGGVIVWLALLPAFYDPLARMPAWAAAVLVFASILPIALPAQLMYDNVLLRLLRHELDRSRCKACGYALAGLPKTDGRTRCPECGREQDAPLI